MNFPLLSLNEELIILFYIKYLEQSFVNFKYFVVENN